MHCSRCGQYSYDGGICWNCGFMDEIIGGSMKRHKPKKMIGAHIKSIEGYQAGIGNPRASREGLNTYGSMKKTKGC